MEHSQKSLQQALDSNLFTVLQDRVLFFDGDTVITPDKVEHYVQQDADPRGGHLCVTDTNSEIKAYNKIVNPMDQIHEKVSFAGLNLDWNIPEQYLTLDVEQYLADEFAKEIEHLSDDDAEIRAYRLRDELALYEELRLLPVLRVIIYVINTLRSYNVVWGIGRGSCVASYVLYLIGVHDVDSVLYELDHTDFLRASG